eukprot:3386609-Alexandrium_andersonii.AAC.1
MCQVNPSLGVADPEPGVRGPEGAVESPDPSRHGQLPIAGHVAQGPVQGLPEHHPDRPRGPAP